MAVRALRGHIVCLSGKNWPQQASQAQKAFSKHENQTRVHVTRLERICRELGGSPRGKKCVGVEGILQQGKDLMKEKPAPDAGLISATQHVEHYEMAGYGTCRTWARTLGYANQAQLFQTT